MPTRSAVLGRANVTTALQDILFTVPAGHTWIVKSILVTNDQGINATITVSAFRPGTLIYVNIVPAVLLNAAVTLTWNGWIALGPGDQIDFLSSLTNVKVWVSGADLLGTN